jgi:hypothetical protein
MRTKLHRSQLLTLASWLFLFCILIFYFMYLLPRKGADFGDEGYYLYSAWAATQSAIPLDTLIPQAPSYILNAVFMTLGIKEYLHFRFIYYAFIVLSLFVFVKGTYRGSKTPEIYPIIVSVGLLGTMTTLLSYHNAPVLLLLMSNGLFFFFISGEHNFQRLLFACLSGAVIALSGFINMSLLPAASLNVLVLYYLHRNERHKNAYLGGFILALIVLFYWYISTIGMAELLRTNTVHSIEKTFSKFEMIFLFLIRWFVVFGLIFVIGKMVRMIKMFRNINTFRIGVTILPFITMFYVLSICQYAFGIDWISATPIEWIKNINVEWGTGRWITGWNLLMRGALGALGLSLFSLAVLTCYDTGETFRRIALSSVFVVLYCYSQLATTSTGPETSIIFYSGPLTVIAFLLFFDRCANHAQDGSHRNFSLIIISICLVLVVLAGLVYQTNYSFNGTPAYVRKELIHVPNLEGILDVHQRRELLERLYDIYRSNNCQDKTLLALASTPLLYYVFEKGAPGGASEIDPLYNWPEKEMLDALNDKKGWCVFWDSGSYSGKEWEKVKHLHTYLINNSTMIQGVGRDNEQYSNYFTEPYSEFTVYIK